MKAVLVGTGWRSNFFLNLSMELPDLLTITAVVSHSKERADELRAKGFNAYSDLDDALKNDHDAAIVCTRKTFYSDLMRLGERGEFVIAETGFLPLSKEERENLKGLKGATLEQYPYTPTYGSVIEASKRIGKIDQVLISGLHNHHAIGVLREILNLDDRKLEEVEFLNFDSKITKTGSREGLSLNGEKEDYTRRLRLLRFNDALYIHDFSSNQYHNYLLGRRVEVRGERGVVTLNELRTTNREGFPISVPIVKHSDSSKTSGSSVVSYVTLADEVIYKNPFYPHALNEDELGIATILRNIEEKRDYKSIADGIRDAELGELL